MVFSLTRIFSYVLAIAGFSLALPLAVAVYFNETGSIKAFAAPMLASIVTAGGMAMASRNVKAPPLSIRGAFTAVGGSWIVLGVFGALPLWLGGAAASFTDAIFESVSGFTTTGASVIPDVENLPRCMNVWRCEMHWLGGMGVIALVVAFVPLLGIGGLHLIHAETTGPEKGKLTTRITNTAKVLWFIYAGLTATEALLLYLCGIEPVEALCHAFSTLGTGGFSTRNGSVGALGNAAAEWICIVFMLLAAVNFALYYRLFTGRFADVRRDSELKVLLGIVAAAVVCISAVLIYGGTGFSSALRQAAFQTASIISTTGFMTADYASWHPAAQAVLLALFFIGGSSGSTAGGVKIVRWTILFKQLTHEFKRMLHPHGIFTLRLNSLPCKETIVPCIASFIFLYFLLVIVTTAAGTIASLKPFEALTAALSMAGNIGPAFGELGPTANYSRLPDFLKWFYCFTMLAGRLEIYTIFILLGSLFSFPSKQQESLSRDNG